MNRYEAWAMYGWKNSEWKQRIIERNYRIINIESRLDRRIISSELKIEWVKIKSGMD